MNFIFLSLIVLSAISRPSVFPDRPWVCREEPSVVPILDHTVMDHGTKHWLYGDVFTDGRRDHLPATTSIWTTPWWTT